MTENVNKPAKKSWYTGKMPRTKAQLLAERAKQAELLDKQQLEEQVNNTEAAPGQLPAFALNMNRHSNIKYVLAVSSGKGGVGKSMLTSSLAVAFQTLGLRTGILDADITGPSIPQAFNLKEQAYAGALGLMPQITADGCKVMSVNLILENADDPIAWRGPIIATAIKQFWTDVAWGDLDILLIDMPPGTGDTPLTVFQSLPVSAAVVVSSPQTLVGTIVKKSLKLLQKMNVPLLALVENYAYFECGTCNEIYQPFGASHVKELAESFNIPINWQIPILPALAQAVDQGELANYRNDIFYNLARRLYVELEKLPPLNGASPALPVDTVK